ncbi:uncharacterized protein LOC105432972 [Pogonomyrmex barbatus]|uniref:Uncharacterized protein LOC105432972 n=1 Tax=Pogonomyrmex barbatus TaxID=144034 RepID=A0A6I9WSU4_9HYME|nr:uncharacterized protein LOC105432972 [Pogonomyrmex barbatus]
MARNRRGTTVLLVVLALASASHGFDVSLNDALDLIKLGRETVVEMLESWEMIHTHGPVEQEGGQDLLVKRMERELRRRIDLVSKKIDIYQERMEIKADTILTQLLLRLPMQRRLDDSLRELDRYIGQVQGLYKIFEMYADNPDRYERYTIVQFAKSCVSPRLGELPDVLKSIHRLMVPSEQQVYNRDVLRLLANQMQVGTGIRESVSMKTIEEMDGFPD